MANTIKIKRSAVPGRVPTIENLELGELAINTHDGKLFLKKEYLNDQQEAEQSIIEFYGKVNIENTLFIQKNGDDSNNGKSWDTAVASFERALELAAARNAPTLIDVAPGIYETEGNLDMPDNCAIRAAHRTVFIRPKTGFEVNNVFRMGSGCFIEGPLFEDWQLDSLTNPTKGFAVSFRPGAVITRAPYAHKIAVRTTPYWGTVAPPLDRENGNPLVGIGAGVVLADGAVCSPYSTYPNIMTWGATPVTHNGIGYCAKNGALINGVNAVSMWAHKHFMALSGGQIILSSCSTQFGDYTMVSSGSRQIILPTEVDIPLTVETADAAAITAAASTIIDDLWNELVDQGYTGLWNAEDETFTRRDAGTFLQAMSWVLQTANEKPMLDFAKGLFKVDGTPVFDSNKLNAFVFSFNFMRDRINLLVGEDAQTVVAALVAALNDTITDPVTISEPSTITAIGHTWTAILAGVALTKIPPAKNQATIQESILELDQGVVIASGQDDQGSALFIGGLEINADTGELTGAPFDQAVNRFATRAVIARSF